MIKQGYAPAIFRTIPAHLTNPGNRAKGYDAGRSIGAVRVCAVIPVLAWTS